MEGECRSEIRRQHPRTYEDLRRVIAGPRAGQAEKIIIGVQPLVGVVDGNFVPGIEVVIDFPVDLRAVGIELGSGGDAISCVGMPAPGPLSHGCVESITAVEDIGMRHGGEKLLADAGRIQLGSIRIPRRAA